MPALRPLPILLAALFSAAAAAHDFSITRVVAVFKADESYLVDVHVHLDALALGVAQNTSQVETAGLLQQLSPEEFAEVRADLERQLQRRLRVRLDDEVAAPLLSFPEFEQPIPPPSDGLPYVFGATARLSGRVPPGTATFSFSASRAFNAVELSIFEEATGRARQDLLVPGSTSAAFRLNEEVTAGDENAPAEIGAGHGVRFGQYLLLGFEHIIPKGLDHILFVLGLYLLSVRLRPLVWQITMFTLAHTLTLALSINGIVSLPGSIVEPLIAASIVYVAVENLILREMKPWRPALVFAFGLLHGLGFAGVLRELGLPPNAFVEALIGFNLGVEFGQLAVVGAAFLLVGWFRHQPWYRKVIVLPGSLAIAAMGAYWVVERTLL